MPGYRSREGRVEGAVGAGWDQMQAQGAVPPAERQMLGSWGAADHGTRFWGNRAVFSTFEQPRPGIGHFMRNRLPVLVPGRGG